MILRRNPPYIHTLSNTPYVYLNMLVAISPCILYAIYTYGLCALALIALCPILSLIIARANDRIKGVADREYYDLSALLSGVIVAMLLPPGTGLLWAVLAVLLSEIVFKQFYGGVGSNPISNPVAAVILINLSVGSHLNGYLTPVEDRLNIKPLFSMNWSGVRSDISDMSMLEIVTGNYAGIMGLGCSLMILLGFFYLVIKKMVRFEAPLTYLLVIAVFTIIEKKINIIDSDDIAQFVIFMVSSGVLFVATFLLTDLTGIAHGRFAGIISGSFCGLLTALLTNFTSEIVYLGVPVLLTNLFAFIIDYIVASVRRGRGDVL